MLRDARIKILLANDHKILCEGLKLLFESKTEMKVLERENGKSLPLLSRELEPDIIIIDINIPAEDNIELSRQILAENPNIRFLAHSERIHAHLINEGIKAGITGFVLKQSGFDMLVKAVRVLYENKTYMCPHVKDIFADSWINKIRPGCRKESSDLTEREYELIRLFSQGRTSKEIGLQMELSSKTIDASRRQIMEKLKIDSFAELVKHAIRVGLTSF